MHIVFLNRSFYPDITATGQLLTELCEDLVKDYNCQVTVIAGRPPVLAKQCAGPHGGMWFIRRENYEGIEILRVANTVFSAQHFIGRIVNYLSYFTLSFIAALKIKKPDIVVTLTDPPIICLAGLWISFCSRIPFVVSVRDIFPEAARGLKESKSKVINLLLERVINFCSRKATHIIALGEIMQKRLIEKGIRIENSTIISDWADCANIFPVSKKNNFSTMHELLDNFVVMYAGNIGASSGLDFVLNCANNLREYKDIVFVFIGEGIRKGGLIERVKQLNLENVRFLPYQPKSILAEVFSTADVYLVPLKIGLSGYSLPSKIYAILASGRPYIACIEEDSEVVQMTHKFDCGLISKPEDYLELGQKLMLLYRDRDLRLRLGENARKAAGFFDRRPQVKKHYELFKKIINDKKGI